MATTVTKVLRMTFTNSLGGAVSMTLPQPKADLTAPQIEAVMDQIIARTFSPVPAETMSQSVMFELLTQPPTTSTIRLWPKSFSLLILQAGQTEAKTALLFWERRHPRKSSGNWTISLVLWL